MNLITLHGDTNWNCWMVICVSDYLAGPSYVTSWKPLRFSFSLFFLRHQGKKRNHIGAQKCPSNVFVKGHPGCAVRYSRILRSISRHGECRCPSSWGQMVPVSVLL